jgi:hypothetical protein
LRSSSMGPNNGSGLSAEHESRELHDPVSQEPLLRPPNDSFVSPDADGRQDPGSRGAVGEPLNVMAQVLVAEAEAAAAAGAAQGSRGGDGEEDGAPADAELDEREEQALLNHRHNLSSEFARGEVARKGPAPSGGVAKKKKGRRRFGFGGASAAPAAPLAVSFQ